MIASEEKKGVRTVEKELTGVASGAAAIFAGKVLGNSILYLYSIVIARNLGVKLFGMFVLAHTIINLAGVICRLGLDAGAVKYVSLYFGMGEKGRVKGILIGALKYAVIASLFMVVVLFFLVGPVISSGFNNSGLVNIIRLFSLSLPFYTVMIIALSFTQGLQKMKFFVYGHNLCWPISNLILVVLFLSLGYGIYGVVTAHVISVILTSILSLYFVKKAFPEIKTTDAISENSKLLRVSLPLSMTLFLNFIISWTDTLMLGYFKSSGEVGIYNVAMKTALLTSTVLFSFNAIFAPMISDLYNRKAVQKLATLFKIVTRWIYIICLAIFLCIALRSEAIIGLFGPDFITGSLCLIILSFAQFVNGAVGSVGLILSMTGKQNLMMFNSFAICLINVVLNIFFIPSYGILGASVATGLSIVIFNLLMLLEVYLLLHMHPYDSKFIKITIIGLVTYGVLHFLDYSFPDFTKRLDLLGYIPLFFIIYATMLLIWGVHEEDRLIFNTVKQKFQKGLS